MDENVSSPPAAVEAVRLDFLRRHSPALHVARIERDNDSSRSADVQAPICRICWGEQDTDLGGNLLAPCKCRGTSMFVHARCLQLWVSTVAERKGPGRAGYCDVCRARYSLPADIGASVRENPLQWARRHLSDAYATAIQRPGPAGPIAHAFFTSAWMYSMLYGSYGALAQLSGMPSLLLEARRDPMALRRIAPRFVLASFVEPVLSTADVLFYFETTAMYALAWLTDACVRLLEADLMDLSPTLRLVAAALLTVPKTMGIAIQAVTLSLMCLFGGGAAGFTSGLVDCAVAPFKVLSTTAMLSAKALSGVALLLFRGGRLPMAMAAFLCRRGTR